MLEQYQIKQQISQKAGRSTYLAEDSETNKQVVIKILEFNDLFTWDDLKLFEREATTLKNLNCLQIPKFLDYFEIDEENRQGFALVQTYINAPSLKELIEQGIHFSEAEIIEIAEKLLDILNHLHQLNPPVIHRDIKPSNILLTNRSAHSVGDIYLVDFGSVQTISKKESGTITIVGSYGYIPLEQFMGKTSFASDLYSLGMTLIYLVTGIHPAELTQDTGKVQFDTNKISKSFANWLQKITEPYLDKRYKSAASALTALHSRPQSTSESKPFNPQYPNLYINRDRDREQITIFCLQDVKRIVSHFGLVFSILVTLVIFRTFGLILISLCLIIASFNESKEKFQTNKYKFRIITINKYKHCYHTNISINSTTEQKAWRELLEKYSYYLKGSFSSSYCQLEKIIPYPKYKPNKYLSWDNQLEKMHRNRCLRALSFITNESEFHLNESTNGDRGIQSYELWHLSQELGDFFLDIEPNII